jgi:hypothetical protein
MAGTDKNCFLTAGHLFLAIPGVTQESEAESGRFHGRQSDKRDPETQPRAAQTDGGGGTKARKAHSGAAGPFSGANHRFAFVVE